MAIRELGFVETRVNDICLFLCYALLNGHIEESEDIMNRLANDWREARQLIIAVELSRNKINTRELSLLIVFIFMLLALLDDDKSFLGQELAQLLISPCRIATWQSEEFI